MSNIKNIVLTEVDEPNIPLPAVKPELPAAIYTRRLEKLRDRMKKRALDTVVIYGDKEHFGNFLYFAGFEPRFEEGILVIHQTGTSYVLLGNECIGMYKNMSIEVEPILCQYLSLPNQTMDSCKSLASIFEEAGLRLGASVGVIGWKLFTTELDEQTEKMFCTPAFIINGIAAAVGGTDYIKNTADILISPKDGLRTVNTADEIALLEYGAAYASSSVQTVQNNFRTDVSELDLISDMLSPGLPMTMHPMLNMGNNTTKGLVSPSDKKGQVGEPVSLCMALRGGLSSRNGYIAESIDDLPDSSKGFIDDLAVPYYKTSVAWYEKIGLGVTGGEIYDLVNDLLPKEIYGWVLNPGHLIAEEEWLSSPVYPGSDAVFTSGMLVQMDIIPSMAGLNSPGCEDGVCLADEELRREIAERYPDMWERMMQRRAYMIHTLGIDLKPEVLPLSNLAAYYRPLFLNEKLAFKAADC